MLHTLLCMHVADNDRVGAGEREADKDLEKEYAFLYTYILRGISFLNNGAFMRIVIFRLRRKVSRPRVEPRTSGLTL